MADSIAERIDAAKAKLKTLEKDIRKAKSAKDDGGMESVNQSTPLSSLKPFPEGLHVRRTLIGHFGKVYDVDWAGDDDVQKKIVSASQDGKLIVWDAFSNNKLGAITLRSSWVMATGFDRSSNKFVASGGLDNICSVYSVEDFSTAMRPSKELAAHEGYISGCRFIDSKDMVTASGDATCMLWDINRAVPKTSFAEHTGDCMAVALDPTDSNVFASASTDATVKVWDIRVGDKSTHTFEGHESDVNSVAFLPNGKSLASGSDDSTCMLWDMRACQSVNQFQNEKILCGVTSVDVSKSGRILFAGYDDNNCYGWDTLEAEGSPMQMNAHQDRVSCVRVSPKGDALCTGSWDNTLKVWA